MVQDGFAVFFLLAFACGILALLASIRESAPEILRALAGHGASAPPRRSRRVRTSERPTAEVPYVARRLASLVQTGLAPVTDTPRIWAFRRADPRPL
ncbi:hypothetical protein [Sphingosinicella sp. BN140058]|uniref:hypothetical protein n=1 Tax=Sphingosinicella sp. BN140058 TaxID=1892855 RepID=UPI001011ADD6|nr:hypothetical protein [Sphingosinicella sp. BN140058]QAY75100.1 hypothetical protein ETR14_00055 [Sphingosinicella sp. BN140058]